ncbi:MAG: hypothetical protein IKN75_06360 [Prevotella sp.]|nr:hypothetical protein [Prevotella sp.]
MRELTKIQSIILAVGALLMVVGTGCVVFDFMPQIASVVFAVGAVMFVAMQAQNVYTGSNFTIIRLRRIMLFADACFIIAAVLLLENAYRFIFPLFQGSIEGYNNYVRYINNNWVVALLVAAILEMYTTHRIESEIKKS